MFLPACTICPQHAFQPAVQFAMHVTAPLLPTNACSTHLADNLNPELQPLLRHVARRQPLRPLHQARSRRKGRLQVKSPHVRPRLEAVQVKVVDGRAC